MGVWSILNSPQTIWHPHLQLNIPSTGGNSEANMILDIGHLKHLSVTAWAHILLLL